jgi:hypothetical protein
MLSASSFTNDRSVMIRPSGGSCVGSAKEVDLGIGIADVADGVAKDRPYAPGGKMLVIALEPLLDVVSIDAQFSGVPSLTERADHLIGDQ